ncbi:MAG: shikimate dehydrogenase [Halolamina sp.]
MDVYGLVGDPVEHSRSPPMHEAAYDELGVDARYVTFEPTATAFDTAIDGAKALGVAGLNVTVPFKEDALAHPGVEPTPTAARVGAVNTLEFGADGVVGDNTDVAGVRRAFAHHDVDLADRRAVVVGAGGAARAAAVALVEAGVDAVAVCNRTVSRAESLAADLRTVAADVADDGDGRTDGDAETGGQANPPTDPATVTAAGLDALGDRLGAASVLVNATSVGMEAPEETPVPAEALHGDLVVLDAVYAPLRTRLLRDAADAGATTVDGAWMLLFQGVEAFERWTGREAPVAAMNETLRETL